MCVCVCVCVCVSIGLLFVQVFEHHSAIASVSNQASHEATLEKMLKKVSPT